MSEDDSAMRIVLQTSLEGIPPHAEVILKDRHCDVTVNFLKHQVFFTAKIKYPDFPDTYLADKYQLYKEDNTLIADDHNLADYGISENDTLYLREEGVRRIFVHWEQQRIEFWVKCNFTVEAIIENVWTKVAASMGLDAGSDMYDMFDAHGSFGREGQSVFLGLNFNEQGKALARNKTLEQLGFTESPELELREKIRSRTPSRAASPVHGPVDLGPQPIVLSPDVWPEPGEQTLEQLGFRTPSPSSKYDSHPEGPSVVVEPPSDLPDIIGVTTEAVTCTGFHVVWKKPDAELNILELNWYKPPAVVASSGPITAYILEYGESCSSAPPCTISLSGVVEEHTVTGLKPHTEYYVKVAAVNAAGRGPFCEPVLVQTAPDIPAAPARQVRTVPTKVMPTSFFLTWCPPPAETTNGPITAYILECGESSGETPPRTISLSGGVEEHTVTGLKPHTEYYVKVAAVNAAGRGAFCEPVLVRTAPDIPDSPPSEVEIGPYNVTSASFLVSWCPPPVETTNGPITAYVLEYGESSGEAPPRTISLSGVVEEHTVTGLESHTEYYVKVAAETAAGRGPFCEPVQMQTAPDKPVAAPENVQVEASEDKPSIFVTWSPIQKQYYNSDSLTGYHVRYTTSSKDCKGGEIEVLPDETSCSLDFLDRGVAYAVSVAAANDVGMGPYSIPSVAIVGAPDSDDSDDPKIDLILRRVSKVLENLTVVSPSERGLSAKCRLIYIAIMDITVLPYLVDIDQCVGITISELCSLLRLPNPSEWYLTRSHGLQVLMSGKSKFQPAVGLSRKKSKKGKKSCFSVGSALSTSLDVDHLLDVTKTWAEADLQSEPCIVHMRPWESKAVKIREEIDFGVVEDAELGQQMYQPWYRITQGHHPVDKATAAEIAALMCMCQAEQVDGTPDPETNLDDEVSSYLPKKLQRKTSTIKAAVQKYNTEKSTTKDVLTAQLQQCLTNLPACNGAFFHIKIPGSGPFGPKMKKGVFGVGPKEIAYGCYDGDTVEVMTRRAYNEIKCFHASENSFTVDFGAHDADEFQASTPRAFDIMHLLKIYIQQQHFLDETSEVLSYDDRTASLPKFNSYPTLTEADVLNPYLKHRH